MSASVVVRTADLRAVLAGVLPHLPSSLTTAECDSGTGMARLAVRGQVLLVLGVARARARFVCLHAPLVERDDEDVPDVWLSHGLVKDLLGVCEGATTETCEVVVDAEAVTVGEVGTLHSPRQMRVRSLPEPLGQGRADAAAELVRASRALLAGRGTVFLDPKDVTAFVRTARAVDEPVSCRLGLAGEEQVVVWGYPEVRAGDEVIPGSAYLGVSARGGTRGHVPVTSSVCYEGELLEPLVAAILPDLDGAGLSEGEESRFAREVEAFVERSAGLDGGEEA